MHIYIFSYTQPDSLSGSTFHFQEWMPNLHLKTMLSLIRVKHAGSPSLTFLFQSTCLPSLIEVTHPFQYFRAKTVSVPRLLLLAPPLYGVSTLQVLCELLNFYPLMALIVLHVPPLESSAYSSILLVYDMRLNVLSLLVC